MTEILIEILNRKQGIEGFYYAVDESKTEKRRPPDFVQDKIQNAIDRAKQKQLSPNQKIRVHECNHDENPVRPCIVHYERYN